MSLRVHHTTVGRQRRQAESDLAGRRDVDPVLVKEIPNSVAVPLMWQPSQTNVAARQ